MEDYDSIAESGKPWSVPYFPISFLFPFLFRLEKALDYQAGHSGEQDAEHPLDQLNVGLDGCQFDLQILFCDDLRFALGVAQRLGQGFRLRLRHAGVLQPADELVGVECDRGHAASICGKR